MGADYPKNPWEKRKDISVTKTIGGCIGEIQGFTAAQKKNRLEVRGPLVPYRTSSLRAKQDRPCPFLHSAFFVPKESKAKLKWFVCLLYLLDEREQTKYAFPGLWIGFSQRHSFDYVVTLRLPANASKGDPLDRLFPLD